MQDIIKKPESNTTKPSEKIISNPIKPMENKSNMSGKTKKIACIVVIITITVIICGVSLAFLWAGGFVKEVTCKAVKEDSYIWDKVKCSEDESSSSSSTSSSNSSSNFTQQNTIQFDTKNVETQEQLVTKIISQAEKAVVSVTIKQVSIDQSSGGIKNQNKGIGTAFIVRKDGLLVTNQHVVSELESEYGVILPGTNEAIPVKNIYRDNVNDIAILKIDKNDLPELPLGNSDDIKRGNLVIAIGNALGELDGTATVGYISGLGRNITAGSGYGFGTRYYEDVIQTDAAINPGNSGGPMINSQGKVVGVNFATTQGAENISFAIPINRIKDKLAEFEKYGKLLQPYIGIAYDQRVLYLKDGVLNGALITYVEKDGPADKGGLKAGDVVLEINGVKMADHSLFSVVQKAKVGDELKMKVWRQGTNLDITVKVQDKSK